jgi:hypothetical protein
VASIIAYRDDSGNNDVTLISQDTGPRLTCRDHGIRTLVLDDAVSLPADVDEIERENRDLRQQLQRLQNAAPRLEAAFVGMDDPPNVAKFVLSKHPAIDGQEVARAVAKIRELYPKMTVPPTRTLDDPHSASLSTIKVKASFGNNAINPEEIQRYNNELDDFYANIESHRRQIHAFHARESRTISFSMEIRNGGSAPADDVDVLFDFPGGFRLMGKKDLPQSPRAPTPPAKPLGRLDELRRSAEYARSVLAQPSEYPDISFPSSFRIDETNSYRVSDCYSRIKHGIPETLPTLYAEFASLHEAKPFKCTYELRAANLTDPVNGELHFVIEVDEGGDA